MAPENNRIEFANTLRGVAAAMVVYGHLTTLFWDYRSTIVRITGIPELPETTRSTTLTILPDVVSSIIPSFNFGAFGVAVFFLISGFVIPISLSNATPWSFLAARTMRLMPTYIVCFSITVAFLAIGAVYFDVPYHRELPDIMVNYIIGLRLISGSPQIDSVAWSLEVEVIFYLLCSAFAALFTRFSIAVFCVPLLFFAAFMANHWLSSPGNAVSRILYYSPYLQFMFIGVIFNQIHHNRMSMPRALAMTAVLLGTFAVSWLMNTGVPNFSAYGVSYFYGLIAFFLCYRYRNSIPTTRVTDYLAEISYPLYAVHAVMSYVLMHIFLQNDLSPNLATVSAVCASLLVATIVHHAVERPTRNWASAIRRKSVRKPAAVTT